MGHLGLTPQSVAQLGGFKAQARTASAAHALYDDARQLEAAGCFALVLEAVPPQVASRVTSALTIPTIGIGAGRFCDGQILIWHDLLGISVGGPRFVRRYAELGDAIRTALSLFATEVRSGAFPEDDHTYSMPDDEIARFEAGMGGADTGG
jgi:3-methyl-2-oxobutanoate hydroxymethyltransferase